MTLGCTGPEAEGSGNGPLLSVARVGLIEKIMYILEGAGLEKP